MISIASSGVYNISTGATTAPIPKPSGLAVGDLMVAVISTVRSAITSAPTGWTVVNSNNLTYNFCTVYKKIADASDVSASTFSWSGSLAIGGIIYRIPEGDFNNIQMSLTAPLTPKTKDNAVILVGTSSDDDSDLCTFSGYSTTGGAAVTYTEGYDSLGTSSTYYAAMGVASGIYSSFDNITAFNVTADASPDATSRFMLLIGDVYTVNYSDVFKNCVAYYKFEGDSKDSSIYANNGADTNITYDDASGKQGKYAKGNGSSSQIFVTHSESLNPKNAITISAWVKQTIGQSSMILQKAGNYYSYGNASSRSLWIGTTLGNLELYSGGGALDDGKWHHWVGTWNNTDGYIRIYIDGKLQATSPTTLFGTLNQNANGLYLVSGGGVYYHSGEIDELGIWNRALSLEEVRVLYALPKSLHKGLISYWKLDGNSYDSVGKNDGYDFTTNYSASYGKIGQGVRTVSAIGAGIRTPDKNMPTGANPWTMSVWVKLITQPATSVQAYICGWGTGGTVGAMSKLLYQNSSGTYSILSAGWGMDLFVTKTIPLNEWVHLVTTYDGTTCKLYYNGQLIDSQAQTRAIILSGYNWISCDNRNGSWDGDIDEVGYWNRALTGEEIQQLFYAGNGNQYPLQTNMADMM